ncbi:MAG: hypothetical protein IPK17_34815 [Chloroflexi bacterium]|uniref:hypothetical protein n=1 Tax=Candidatus Flexifilum breve TaxID=3140694 RepID=UPI0031353259|nr:hypothetical protein [Chloroflexota bacterium]
MWENMAHGGDDLYWDGNWVNFHWFLAPVVAAGIIEQTYGGVYANQQYGQAFGLDGCEILNFVADPAQMRFAVKERLNRRRTVPVVLTVARTVRSHLTAQL